MSRVLVPVAAVAAVAAVRWLLDPLLREQAPLLIFLLPVFLAAFYCGIWAGLIATGLSVGVAAVLFMRPHAALFDRITVVQTAMFLAEGVVVSWLNEKLHAARRRAADDAAHLRRTEGSLRASEERLRGIVESAMDAIIGTDNQHRIVVFNPAAEHMFGCDAAWAIGRDIHDLVPWAEPGPSTGRLGTLVGRRCNGEEFPAEASISSVESGGRRTFTLVLRDVTERRRVEAERDALHRSVAEANRQKDEFLAMLSHELRTPLNVMLGWTWRLRQGVTDPAMVSRALTIIERNTRAQQRLIDELLDLSRIGRGEMHIERRPVDIGGLVLQTLEGSRPAAEARGLQLTADVPDGETPLVSGDENRLQQVLGNLVSNAIKFTPPGGMVEVHLRVANQEVVLEVRDTGVGIPPDFLPHVFDRFRQLDGTATRTVGGLGLGLAIVRHIVDLHGGHVSAASGGTGRGATFTVRLPLAGLRAEASGLPRGRRAEDPRGLDGVRVLAVEDEDDTRDLVRELLLEWGAEVRVVGTAEDAMAALVAQPPDVLITDVRLPGDDGYALIRRVRALDPAAGGGVPAVALTAYLDAEDRGRVLAAGFQVLLTKPLDPEALRAAIVRLARRR